MHHMLTHSPPGAPTAPIRNRYFYGKLLDVRSQEMEQAYGVGLRRLLNRVGHGAGVLCGLQVRPDGDGDQVWVEPGVAIDGLGREIVVTEARCVENPSQPLDDCGDPEGEPVTDGTLTLCIAYHECEVDPVPVLVEDCDSREGCRPGAVRERYRVLIQADEPDPPGGLSEEQCATIFPEQPAADFDRRAAACEALTGPCPEPEPVCVPLATLGFKAGQSVEVHECPPRTTVYSNARLFDMLLCLAERVEECCRLELRYVSGDAQTALAGEQVPEPVMVEVRDRDDRPVDGELVTFRALGGAGKVSDGGAFNDAVEVASGADGRADARWQLGPDEGLNTLEATIEGGGRIAFHALSGQKEEPESPPIVEAIWPPNGGLIPVAPDTDLQKRWKEQWREQPRIEITFDREMNQAEIEDPEPWLRVWRIRRFAENEIEAKRIVTFFIQPGDVEPMLEEEGWKARWGLEHDVDFENSRWLVQVRARDPEHPIHEAAAAGQLLDPDFKATKFTNNRLEEIWSEDPPQWSEADWDSLPGTGSLEGTPHSGDGTAGGALNSWFAIGIEEE
jgi:hypothetical protein